MASAPQCWSPAILDPRYVIAPSRPFHVWERLASGDNATLTVFGGSVSAGAKLKERSQLWSTGVAQIIGSATRGGSIELNNLAQGVRPVPRTCTASHTVL